MAKSKLIVADPINGKSTMYELNDDQFRIFKGLKIGSKIDGSSVNVEGELTITGGSDHGGFPMRSDVLGGVKKYVLLTKGVGFRSNQKGLKRRKLVRGNTITEEIYQINTLLTNKSQLKPPTTKKEVPSDIDLTSKENEAKTTKKEDISKIETKEKQENELSEKKSKTVSKDEAEKAKPTTDEVNPPVVEAGKPLDKKSVPPTKKKMKTTKNPEKTLHQNEKEK